MSKIDPTARVEDGAVIGEGTTIGPYCIIGAGAAGLAQDHGHDAVLVRGAALAVLGKDGIKCHVGHDVAVDDDKLVLEDGLLVQLSHAIADRRHLLGDDAEYVEWRCLGDPF